MIKLEFMYPGNLSGHDESVIYMNGKPAKTVKMEENVVKVELETDPYRVVHLKFENNFYMQNAQEQRGVKRLAAIVNITAD